MLPILLLLALTGCIVFETQTMSYRYDKPTDTLRLFQDYHGICGEGDKARALTKTEKEQVDSVLKGQRSFFFNNWLTEYDQNKVKELLGDLEKPKEQFKTNLTATQLADLQLLLKELIQSVHIENGPFYLNSGRQLSGAQYVTVTNVSALITDFNRLAPALFKSEFAGPDTTPEDKAALETFVAKSKPMLQFNGNALTIRWPMSRNTYNKEFGTETDGGKWLAQALPRGLSSRFTDDTAELTVGKPDNKITSLTIPFSTNSYSTNLIEFAKQRHTIIEKFDVTEAAEEFLMRGRVGSSR